MTPDEMAREERRLGLSEGRDPIGHVSRARRRAVAGAISYRAPLTEAAFREWAGRLSAAGLQAPAPWHERRGAPA